MTEVLLREAKLLAMRRLRGVDAPPTCSRDVEHQVQQQEHDGSNIPPLKTTDAPPFIWARPQVTVLWGQIEKAVRDAEQQHQQQNANNSGPNTKNNNDSFLSPGSSVVSYLTYRQTMCRELSRELGYDPSKAHDMDVASRAKVLSMYRQHLCAGPATFFDLWRNENRDALRQNAEIERQVQDVLRLQQQSSNTTTSKEQRRAVKELQQQKMQLRDPSLVDTMSQVGAIGFFADLRSLLDGIRAENAANASANNNNNNNQQQRHQEASTERSASTQSAITNSTTAGTESQSPPRSPASQQRRDANNNKTKRPAEINPMFRNLLRRLKNRHQQQKENKNTATPQTDQPSQDQGDAVAHDIFHSSDDSAATLSLGDLENFVKELLPNIRGARDAPPWLQPYYVAHAVSRIAFDADATRRGRVTTSAVLESPALTDLLQLHEAHSPDAGIVFPREFPINISIHHAEVLPPAAALLESDDAHDHADGDGKKETDDQHQHQQQQQELYEKHRQLLHEAVAEAAESADPSELTLVEAIVIDCPSSSEHEEAGGDHEDGNDHVVTCLLPLAEGTELLLRVPRAFVFFPTSRESLHRFRQVMELLVCADASGDRAGAAELDMHMRTASGVVEQQGNSTNQEEENNAVDNVDSSVVVLSSHRRVAENWFSLPRMLNLYYDFCVLDTDHDGVLREAELMHYRKGALTPLAISRVFEVFAHEGCIAYTAYLDFVIAMEYPHLAASQRYLWKLMDVEGHGASVPVKSLMFFAIEICRVLEEEGVIIMSPEGLMTELLDMLRLGPDCEEVHFERDVLRGSKMGGVVLPLLIDWHSFVKYESREQQRQAEEVDEES